MNEKQLMVLMYRMYSEASRVREITDNKLESVMKERPEMEPEVELLLDAWSSLFAQMRKTILDTLTAVYYIQQSTELPD